MTDPLYHLEPSWGQPTTGSKHAITCPSVGNYHVKQQDTTPTENAEITTPSKVPKRDSLVVEKLIDLQTEEPLEKAHIYQC
jgi:hypothetical protein